MQTLHEADTLGNPAVALNQTLALAAEHGFAIFPLAKGKKKPLKNSHGFKDATRDERQLREWFERTDHDPGIATGSRSRDLVIDIDEPTKAAAFFAQHPALPATFTVLTGRPGGRHLHFALPECVTVPSFDLPGINVKCEGGYVAGPGARHSSGAVYRIEVPAVPRALCPEWFLDLARRKQKGAAPRVVIKAGRRKGIYRLDVGERRNGLTERAGYYRFRGATQTQALALLHRDNRELCHPAVADGWVDAIVASVWKYPPSLKAVLHAGSTIKNQPLPYIAEVEAAITAASWGGRTGATDLAVLLAFLIIAKRSRLPLFEADYRTIADMAGESLGTTWRAVQRLQAPGWRWLSPEMSYEPLDDPHRGTVWALKAVHSPGTESQREEERNCSTSVHPLVAALLNHDAFRRKGLTKQALFLLGEVILNGPATGAELSRRRGVHRNTVGTHMKKLAEQGLVGRNEQGQWVALVVADVEQLKPRLDEVAQAVGTAGMGEKQWLRHLRERCLFRDRVRAMGWGDRPSVDAVPSAVLQQEAA